MQGDQQATRWVEIREVRPDLLLHADAYIDELMRELELVRLGQHGMVAAGEQPAAALERFSRLLDIVEAPRRSAHRQAAIARRQGRARATISLHVPPLVVVAAPLLLRSVGEIQRYAAGGRLLTLPAPQEVASFVTWWIEAILAAAPPLEPPDRRVAELQLHERLSAGGPAAAAPPAESRSDDGHAVFTTLHPDPSAPRSARALLRSALREWQLSELTERAEVPVSELVTNAVLHARSPIEFRLRAAGQRLRIEVCDASNAAPVPSEQPLEASVGRGLPLVEAFADRWGTTILDHGKCVWFELDADTPPFEEAMAPTRRHWTAAVG